MAELFAVVAVVAVLRGGGVGVELRERALRLRGLLVDQRIVRGELDRVAAGDFLLDGRQLLLRGLRAGLDERGVGGGGDAHGNRALGYVAMLFKVSYMLEIVEMKRAEAE